MLHEHITGELISSGGFEINPGVRRRPSEERFAASGEHRRRLFALARRGQGSR